MIRIAITCVALLSLGCSSILAATDAPEVNTAALGVGTPKRHVIATLGAPLRSQPVEQGTLDLYEFESGMGDRALRTVGYGAAFLLTGGISELLTTPVEAVKRGETYRAEVLYDEHDLCVALSLIHI